jgi:hypothetical protein
LLQEEVEKKDFVFTFSFFFCSHPLALTILSSPPLARSNLPLTESVNKILKALDVHGVVIKAPPGSGKTSFIVRILLFFPSLLFIFSKFNSKYRLLENCKDPKLGLLKK